MSRINKLLLLLLVTQLALIAYMYRPDRVSVPPTVQFFADIDESQVVGLTITDGERTVTMQKEGAAWHLGAAPHYPVDVKKVEGLVKKLLALTSSRLVTHTAASHDRLKVASDNFTRKLTLSMQGGGSKELLLGTAPNYKSIHVRSPENDNVYLVKGLADWEAAVAPEDWWANNYLDVEPTSVQSVSLRNSHGLIKLSRDKENKWQGEGLPAGKTLADEALHAFLSKACLVQLSAYLGRERTDAEFGLDKPLVDLELVTASGPIHFKVAAATKADQKDEYVAKASNSPFYVTVHGYEIKGLLDASLPQLLASGEEASPSGKD